MSEAAPSSVFRFAPTPNGALHLGHAYSALMNQRRAGETGGRLLLRIEDLDRSRCKRLHEDAIRFDLAWLGVGFDGAPRRQSEHTADYAARLSRLEQAGLVYPCFCSRAEVARAAVGRDPDGAPLYSGACRALTGAQRRARLARGDKAARRLDMGRALAAVAGPLAWIEYGEGTAAETRIADPAAWGDVVLGGRDLAASYHLAVTVDDALQGVTDVVRGRDLLAATSVHRLLQALMGLPAPRYRHHRLVLDPAGGKLAKSRGSPSLADLRAQGISAAEVVQALGFGRADAPAFEVALS
ncbi:glutamyl-Q tRNA(Asp) synthetase [Roseiarcus fermentans]|uniref:Glutamyl-Q tRNA(Asp) synthetase n=1 Tax=Roseiarcus fermentans TaxID=1473586 RepID=A0A366F0N3_9HYPH|nr:tRNA glutamyl-Q(34) synthetase GluQRS [Roseiarcus fermentans]RBP07279.1 glutamyl-Q tRNA(Asp) synthetase [Roseiarcus fermentans]